VDIVANFPVVFHYFLGMFSLSHMWELGNPRKTCLVPPRGKKDVGEGGGQYFHETEVLVVLLGQYLKDPGRSAIDMRRRWESRWIPSARVVSHYF